MRAADRRNEQRVRLGGDDSFESRINSHDALYQLSTFTDQPPQRLRRDNAVKAWVSGHTQLFQIYPQRPNARKKIAKTAKRIGYGPWFTFKN